MLDTIRKIAQYLEYGFAAALPVLAWLRSVDPATQSEPLARFLLQEIRDQQIAIAAVLGVGVFVSKIAQAVLERWSTKDKALKAVLESAQKVYFKDILEDHPDQTYQHRVTLFKARRHLRDFPWRAWQWRDWPWNLWKRALRIQCRSGTAYQLSSTRLPVDDENETANEGVAGRAWFTNAAITVSDLPEWPVGVADPEKDPVCRAYAVQGFMSVKRSAAVRVKSRSVSAHVVRTKKGERWGVLVFDSRDPKGVADEPGKTSIMELSAHLLSQLL